MSHSWVGAQLGEVLEIAVPDFISSECLESMIGTSLPKEIYSFIEKFADP